MNVVLKFACGLALLTSLICSAGAQDSPPPESLYLYIGIEYDHFLPKPLKGKALKFEGTYRRFTRLKHNALTGEIRFTPKRRGVGTLNIKNAKGKTIKRLLLNVRTTNLREIANEIQSLLKTVDGITIRIVNNKVTVDGEILVPRDMRRIHDVVTAYPGKANSFVTLSPLAQSKVAKFIEKEINNPNVTVRVINTTFILEGFVNSPAEKQRAEKIAFLYVPDRISDAAVGSNKVREVVREMVVNYITVRSPKKDERRKMIQLIVHYVELNKDYSDNFRFQWMPQIEDGTKFTFTSSHLGAGAIGGIITGTINNFLPKLNWAKSFGFARVLHSGNIITEEGSPAELNSSRAVPYQATVGPNGEIGIKHHPVQIKMKMTPNIIGPRRDTIKISIAFNVDSLVGTSGNAPITTSRALSTNIHVGNGLSAVIGGLITNKSFSDYNREPSQVSSNPLLSFLSSKKFNRSQSQFVVFVTPVIKSSASAGVTRIKKKFKL